MMTNYQDHSSTDDVQLLKQFVSSRDFHLREQIIIRYLPLVHFAVGRLGISVNGNYTYDDLVNQGVMGLIEAVDRYDPDYKTQFSTFAITKIRGNILDYLRGQDWLPRTARQRTKQVQKATQDLWNQLKRSPTDEEVANYLDLTVEQVRQALIDASQAFMSLDSFNIFDQEDDMSVYEALPDENSPDPTESIEEMDTLGQLEKALVQLSERERTILSLYYFDELTLKEIGSVLGITESRVSQLHARAILDLKSIMRDSATVSSQEKIHNV